jgi:diacylglycerol kinase family enzyme
MEQTWYAIVNPAAGGSRGNKRWKLIEADLKAMNIVFEPHFTDASLHASHIAVSTTSFGW